jgi:hypothetical protein
MTYLRVFFATCILTVFMGIGVSMLLGPSAVLAAAENTDLLDLNTATVE